MTDYIWKANNKTIMDNAKRAAGILREVEDENGNITEQSSKGGTLPDGTSWAAFGAEDFGSIRIPTGNTIIDDFGNEVPEYEDVTDQYLIGRSNGNADLSQIFASANNEGAVLVWSSDMVEDSGEVDENGDPIMVPVPRPPYIPTIL